MDAARSKALLRSRMKEAAQKREKRIESPLVRYNEVGQPVCKVCNVAVKSELLWPAHLASRQHKEAVDELKAQAKGASVTSAKSTYVEPVEPVEPTKIGTRLSSSLPDDFFDSSDAKRVATGDTGKFVQQLTTSTTKDAISRSTETLVSAQNKIPSSSVSNTDINSTEHLEELKQSERKDEPAQAAQDKKLAAKVAQGSLPEGFFDSVDADHRARGLEPPKYDIQDEWKEFQKSIRDDIQEVDHRLEEEEYDAAEDREELETLEQRAFLERIVKLRQKQQEKAAATEIAEVIAKAASKKAFANVNLDMDEESGSDGDSEEENLLVDWRAKQL